MAMETDKQAQRGTAFILGLTAATIGACIIFGWGPSLLVGGLVVAIAALGHQFIIEVRKRKEKP